MTDGTETAILAGGCAWIMQQLLRHPHGVISTRVGGRVARATTRPRPTLRGTRRPSKWSSIRRGIHGVGTPGKAWTEDLAELAADATVITYDRRGYGESSSRRRD